MDDDLNKKSDETKEDSEEDVNIDDLIDEVEKDEAEARAGSPPPPPTRSLEGVGEEAPAGFPNKCPECGAWKSKVGLPFNTGSLNFHRYRVHGITAKKDREAAKAAAATQSPATVTVPISTPEPEEKEEEIPVEEDTTSDDVLFDQRAYEEDIRSKQLARALQANTFMEPKERKFILNHWAINPQLREDPRSLYDFIMRIPRFARNPEWANDIVTITFAEEQNVPPITPGYRPPRGYMGGNNMYSNYPPPRHVQQQPYGYEYRQPYYDPYSQYGPPPPPPDYMYQQYRPPVKGPDREESIKLIEMRYQHREEMLKKDKEIEDIKRDLLRIAEEAKQQQAGPPMDIGKTIEDTVLKLEALRGPKESPEQKAMAEEIRKLRDDLTRQQTANAVTQATEPMKRELAELRNALAQEISASRAKRSAVSELEDKGLLGRDLGDEAQVAIEEIKTQQSQFVTVANNLNQTVGKALDLVAKVNTPMGRRFLRSNSASDEELRELEKAAGK